MQGIRDTVYAPAMARKDKTQSPEAQNGTPLDTSPLFADFKPEEVSPQEKPEVKPPKKSKKVVEIQTPAEPPIVCGDDEANALLDLMQPICSTAASRIYGIDGKITSRAFQFTADHRKRINPPLVRVMNKWLPSMVKRWSDEIGLAIVLSSVVNAQVKVMHMMADAEKRAQVVSKEKEVTPISAPAPVVLAPAPAVTIENAAVTAQTGD